MLFYPILKKKTSKNGVLYGLNKEHVNFIAHHETKFSHGVRPAGPGGLAGLPSGKRTSSLGPLTGRRGAEAPAQRPRPAP